MKDYSADGCCDEGAQYYRHAGLSMEPAGAYPLAVEVLPITDARLQKAWDHDLYRVRLTMTGNVFTMEVA